MAIKYLNRFSIEEDDQFEIHVKDYTNKWRLMEEDMYNAAKEVMLKAQQGSGQYRFEKLLNFEKKMGFSHAYSTQFKKTLF